MEFALKLLLRERNLGDAVLALEAIGVKGLETLEILEGAEIDVMVENDGIFVKLISVPCDWVCLVFRASLRLFIGK